MLGQNGATVALNFLADDPRGPETVAKLKADGLSIVAAPGNVAVAGGAEAMVEAAVQRLGRLDLLVNNAGTPGVRKAVPPAELDRITEELWTTVLQTNLVCVFRCSRAACPALRAPGGAVVRFASISGINSPGRNRAYGAGNARGITLTT